MEKLKTSYVLEKTLFLSIICISVKMKMKNIQKRRINGDVKNSWFKWKYIITLKIWVKNLDRKIWMKQEIISLKK